MIPRPDQALRDLAIKIATAIAPEVATVYGTANAGMVSMLLLALSEELERAVSNRLEDAAEMREIFARAAHAPGKAARAAFAASSPPGYRLSQVSGWHDEGMTLLIDLHAWAETEDDALNLDIWDFLVRHTERNRFDS